MSSPDPDPRPDRLTRLRTSARALPHPLRWAVAAVGGGSLVLAGLAMLVLPGPGIAVLLAGLAVLAIEFTWAEVLLTRMRSAGSSAWSAVRRRR